MGLDLVEFVMAVEDAFEISIPDADASRISTPGDVVDYLVNHLPTLQEGVVVEQRAFYHLRSAIAHEWAIDRKSLLPSSPLGSLLPSHDSSNAWKRLGARLEVPRWPATPKDNWWAKLFAHPRTLGDLARQMTAYTPSRVLSPHERWTRGQIEEVVRRLVERELGVAPGAYTLASRFVQDLNVD